MEDVITLISSVGFPIAAFCMMFYMCNATLRENTKAVTECTELVKQLAEKGNSDDA